MEQESHVTNVCFPIALGVLFTKLYVNSREQHERNVNQINHICWLIEAFDSWRKKDINL